QLSPVKCHRAPTLPLDLPVPATFYWLGANHATLSGPCSSLVTRHSSLLHCRSFSFRCAPEIDIFFDERPAHSKKYRTHRIGCPLGKERSALGVTSAPARTLLTHSAQRNHRFDPTSSARRDPAGEKRDA